MEFVRIWLFFCQNPCFSTFFKWKLSELENVGIGNCQNKNLSESKFVRIGNCPNWNLSELEFVRIGNCQNWELSKLEFVRIGICQNQNLSESEFVRICKLSKLESVRIGKCQNCQNACIRKMVLNALDSFCRFVQKWIFCFLVFFYCLRMIASWCLRFIYFLNQQRKCQNVTQRRKLCG